MNGSEAGAPRLGIDPTLCQGIGICAHLAPRVISADSWGYPVIAEGPLARREERSARAAVSACPRRALFLGR